jgi:hypothetical protein
VADRLRAPGHLTRDGLCVDELLAAVAGTLQGRGERYLREIVPDLDHRKGQGGGYISLDFQPVSRRVYLWDIPMAAHVKQLRGCYKFPPEKVERGPAVKWILLADDELGVLARAKFRHWIPSSSPIVTNSW